MASVAGVAKARAAGVGKAVEARAGVANDGGASFHGDDAYDDGGASHPSTILQAMNDPINMAFLVLIVQDQ